MSKPYVTAAIHLKLLTHSISNQYQITYKAISYRFSFSKPISLLRTASAQPNLNLLSSKILPSHFQTSYLPFMFPLQIGNYPAWVSYRLGSISIQVSSYLLFPLNQLKGLFPEKSYSFERLWRANKLSKEDVHNYGIAVTQVNAQT